MTGVRVMPACPPMARWNIPDFHTHLVYSMGGEWIYPHWAFCYAQALAARDGKRRQVRKVGELWQVSEASVCQHESWECVDGLLSCHDCSAVVEAAIRDADDEAARAAWQVSEA